MSSYGVDPKRLSREPFTCAMCKQSYVGQYRYVYNTFEILPERPQESLIICEKCAVRESGFKTKKKFKEFYDK